MPHTITIERDPRERGSKLILVDGAHWGTITMKSHGAANSYFFHQKGQMGAIERPSPGTPGRTHEVRVLGDKLHKKRIEPTHPDFHKTVTERLLLEVRCLIAEGRLRDPAEVKAEQETRHRLWKAHQEQAKADAQDSQYRKINEVLTALPITLPTGPDRGRLVDAIDGLMKWAQEH